MCVLFHAAENLLCSRTSGQRRSLGGRVCVCVPLSSQQFSAVLMLRSRTHAALQPPKELTGGNSSDVDKWARSGMDSPAGNTAMQPAAATHEQNGNSDRPES